MSMGIGPTRWHGMHAMAANQPGIECRYANIVHACMPTHCQRTANWVAMHGQFKAAGVVGYPLAALWIGVSIGRSLLLVRMPAGRHVLCTALVTSPAQQASVSATGTGLQQTAALQPRHAAVGQFQRALPPQDPLQRCVHASCMPPASQRKPYGMIMPGAGPPHPPAHGHRQPGSQAQLKRRATSTQSRTHLRGHAGTCQATICSRMWVGAHGIHIPNAAYRFAAAEVPCIGPTLMCALLQGSLYGCAALSLAVG